MKNKKLKVTGLITLGVLGLGIAGLAISYGFALNDENRIVGQSSFVEQDDYTEQANLEKTAQISADEAKKIVTEANPDFTAYQVALDEENGRAIYTVEVFDQTGAIYDVEVGAVNGEILRTDREHDRDDYVPQQTTSVGQSLLTEEEAKAYVLTAHPDYTINQVQLDDEDGRMVYQITATDANQIIYEVHVDAMTGAILLTEYED